MDTLTDFAAARPRASQRPDSLRKRRSARPGPQRPKKAGSHHGQRCWPASAGTSKTGETLRNAHRKGTRKGTNTHQTRQCPHRTQQVIFHRKQRGKLHNQGADTMKKTGKTKQQALHLWGIGKRLEEQAKRSGSKNPNKPTAARAGARVLQAAKDLFATLPKHLKNQDNHPPCWWGIKSPPEQQLPATLPCPLCHHAPPCPHRKK